MSGIAKPLPLLPYGTVGKICAKCGALKPLDDYHKSKTGAGGRNSVCIPCRSTATKINTPRTLADGGVVKFCSKCSTDKPITEYGSGGIGRTHSHCKQCRRQGVIDRVAKNGYPLQVKEQRRRWRERNPERIREYRRKNQPRANILSKEWRDRNRDRWLQVIKAYREKNAARINAHTKRSKAKKPELYRALARVGQHVRRARKRSSGRFTSKEWMELCEKYGECCVACGTAGKLEADHIVPLSRGGGNTVDNIQPLCVRCNRRKFTRTIDYRPF